MSDQSNQWSEEDGDETIIADGTADLLQNMRATKPAFQSGEQSESALNTGTLNEPGVQSFSEDPLDDDADEDCTIIAEMPFDGRVGQEIAGRYEILRIIGEGGVAIVYEAEDHQTRRHCAIKVLKQMSAQGQWRQRFDREVRLAAQLKSPNIVEQLDAGILPDKRPYLVQELLYGKTLGDQLEEGPVDPRTAVSYAYSILSALEVAHAHGVIHRDLKPENVFLTKLDGQPVVPKILDFGFAIQADEAPEHRLTVVGMAVGTPRYMSPEQFSNPTKVDHRADLYAVGIMLYEMLKGLPPFLGDEPEIPDKIKGLSLGPRLGWMHINSTPQNIPGMPPKLMAYLQKILAKRPDDRFASASEAKAALQGVLQRPEDMRPPMRPTNVIAETMTITRLQPQHTQSFHSTYQLQSLTPPKKRTDWLLIGLAALAVTLVAIAVILTLGR